MQSYRQLFLSDVGILNKCGDRNLNALDIILKRLKCKSDSKCGTYRGNRLYSLNNKVEWRSKSEIGIYVLAN